MKVPREYKEISTRAIIKADRLIGSENALAKIIDVNRQNINYWKSSHGLPPYDKAVKICVATKGKVTLYELRPDLKSLTDDWIKLILEQSGIEKNKSNFA
jgi:hypothetical protein